MCFKHLMRKLKTTSTTITITTLTPNQTTTPTSPFIKGGLRGIFFKAQGGLRKMYQLFGADHGRLDCGIEWGVGGLDEYSL